ncbi:MAG: arginine--tRNA ligase [Patescibacteria group bacterium]|jgi:arginyl-tRNA synthetase
MPYFINKLQKEILSAVEKAVGQELDISQLEITRPPEAAMGDLAVPCFYLTKLLRISPNQVALEIKQKIKLPTGVKSVSNFGPYLNFFLNEKHLAKAVISEVKKKEDKYGRLPWKKEKVMIEYSQPNTHKEFHVGHLRNAVLGSALVNLYRFVGQKVIAVNYIGDIGSHVAKCLWALDKFHKKDPEPAEHKGQYLGRIYSEAVQKTEASEKYRQEAQVVQKKLEAGDKYWTALWKKTRAWSLQEFDGIYKILGIKFDKFFFESEVEKPGKKIVAELLAQGVAEKSEGAIIIDLEQYGLKQFLLLKSDGTSLYSTKELALAKLKFDKYKIDASYVVVDSRQSFYFQQFFKTLEIMGFHKKTKHIAYEFVTLPEGAMASRQGNVVLFEDLLAEMAALAQAETAKRHSDWGKAEIASTAEKIALAAIKFSMLKVGKNSVIVFNPQEALSFDGYSGPYLQYTVTRINSILRKNKSISQTVDYALLADPAEKELLIKLAEFPQAINEAAQEFEPSTLGKYLFDLAKIFSSYYQEVPILNSEDKLRSARLALIAGVRQVLTNGLDLLGIETLERM